MELEGAVCDNCREGHLYAARYINGPEKVVGGLFVCCCVCGATYQAEKLKPYLDPDDSDLEPDYINIT